MTYRKDIDAVLLMYSVLKRLGSGEVDTFIQRLRSQKTQYLAQVFSVSPAYDFRLYVRGPYSSMLADDLFQLKNDAVKPKIEVFTPSELEERFQGALAFIKDKTTRQLELIATLHWLQTVVNLTNDAAIRRLRDIKEANDKEVIETSTEVKKLCQLSKK